MAYTIKMGSFSKLENSTAQPVMTSWAEYSVVFKDGADLSNPEITLAADFATIAGYNYAYMLNRYYWITDIKVERTGYVRVSLKVDVLATYKSQIGNTNLYVLRSSTAADGTIRDNFYATKATAITYHALQAPTADVPGLYSSGVIVLSVAGTNTTTGTILWQLSVSEFKRLILALYVELNGFQLSDVISKVVQLFGGNPQTLINGAMWFPFGFGTSAAEQLYIGGWAATEGGTPIYGQIINGPVQALAGVSFTVVKHPDQTSRGRYLNLLPYTQYTMGIPGCGVIPLDNGKLLEETGITVNRYMDAFSGQLFVKVECSTTGQILAVLSGQIGIPITLSGQNNAGQIIGGASSTIGAGAAAAITASPIAIAGAVVAGIGTAIEAMGGTGTSTHMGAGAAGIMGERIWLDTVCYEITDSDNAQNGRPLCQIRKPSALNGYMIVSDGYVEIAGPLPEQQEIKRFLETGFFYE